MRKEPFAVGSYVHVTNRGCKKMPIVRDEEDRIHFEKILYFLNNSFSLPENWIKTLKKNGLYNKFEFLSEWRKRTPLVEILAYTLMPNHIHLLLNEITENGIANFMRKISNSMTGHFNLKYEESGSLFQGSYKSKTIDSDDYLKSCAAYIMVKNTFELRNNLMSPIELFDEAYSRAINYQYSSLAEYVGKRNLPIINKDLLEEIFPTPQSFYNYSKDYILNRKYDDQRFNL